MRKLLLVAFAAAAMVVTALPSASLANTPKAVAAEATCPPGAADTQYCENPCPHSVAALNSTVDAAVAAALPAVQNLTAASTALTFSFVSDACSRLNLRLAFGEPRRNGKLVFFNVGISVVLTSTGGSLTVRVPLTGLGQHILAAYGATHETLNVRVIATARHKSKSATNQGVVQIKLS